MAELNFRNQVFFWKKCKIIFFQVNFTDRTDKGPSTSGVGMQSPNNEGARAPKIESNFCTSYISTVADSNGDWLNWMDEMSGWAWWDGVKENVKGFSLSKEDGQA